MSSYTVCGVTLSDHVPFKHATQALKESQGWLLPFEQTDVVPHNEEQSHAWFHWCLGHHLSFIYWQTMAYCCKKISHAIKEDNTIAIELWVERLEHLIIATAAVMKYTSDFDRKNYSEFLRPAMIVVRQDFSALSSRDFFHYFQAKSLVTKLSEEIIIAHPHLVAVFNKLEAAEKEWMIAHLEVINSLSPGPSLLQKTVHDLVKQGMNISRHDYVEKIVKSTEAFGQYDHFFGVMRNSHLTIEEYWLQAINKIDLVQQDMHFSWKLSETLIQGNAVLQTILAECLAS